MYKNSIMDHFFCFFSLKQNIVQTERDDIRGQFMLEKKKHSLNLNGHIG